MAVEIVTNVLPVCKLPPESTVENWVANGGCSRFMTPSTDYMVNYWYCEIGGAVRVADDRVMPIEGIGNIPMCFWSGKGRVVVIFRTSLSFHYGM